MSAKRLIIQLDPNPFGVYLTGQVVSGAVFVPENNKQVISSKGIIEQNSTLVRVQSVIVCVFTRILFGSQGPG